MIGAIRARLRSRLLLALVACALLVRVAVPAGWMPDASAHGFGLVLCTGTIDASQDTAWMSPTLRAAFEKQHPASDHSHQLPCDFAAAGHAANVHEPVLAANPSAPPAPQAGFAIRPSLAPGRGLAAPPPPPTGPPTI